MSWSRCDRPKPRRSRSPSSGRVGAAHSWPHRRLPGPGTSSAAAVSAHDRGHPERDRLDLGPLGLGMPCCRLPLAGSDRAYRTASTCAASISLTAAASASDHCGRAPVLAGQPHIGQVQVDRVDSMLRGLPRAAAPRSPSPPFQPRQAFVPQHWPAQPSRGRRPGSHPAAPPGTVRCQPHSRSVSAVEPGRVMTLIGRLYSTVGVEP
jgi:hypothetical protein